MSRQLDLSDIQGNIIRAYGHYGFPIARYFFLHIDNKKSDNSRKFIDAIRLKVTTSERWGPGNGQVPRPNVTLNVGFSWYGLLALNLPTHTLTGFPSEYIDGMKMRAHILGDQGESAPKKWDPIWKKSEPGSKNQVHIWISINAGVDANLKPLPELEEQTNWLREEVTKCNGGVRLLLGHGRDPADDYQEAAALMHTDDNGNKIPISKEHFGFNDGIGDPVFEKQLGERDQERYVIGRGKLMPAKMSEKQQWKPIATGEFLLGQVDEAQELPQTAKPNDFTRNGTFMAYRKLHENVKSFKDYVSEQAVAFQTVMGCSTLEEANDTIKAKMAGRWPNGVPLIEAPTYKEWQEFNAEWADVTDIYKKKMARLNVTKDEEKRLREYKRLLIDFKYGDDVEGHKCPVSSHIRRTNPRDMLDPKLNTDDRTGSSLNKRRRIMRRGLPYGKYNPENPNDTGEQGIIFMALCSSLFRQFEFVQQQWIQYGLDFNVGNDTCPLLGKHEKGDKFVIASDPETKKPPFICADLPPFVATRGGDYFFIPSLTSLRMIAMGIIDPT